MKYNRNDNNNLTKNEKKNKIKLILMFPSIMKVKIKENFSPFHRRIISFYFTLFYSYENKNEDEHNFNYSVYLLIMTVKF